MKYKYQFSNKEIPIIIEKSKRKSMVISVRSLDKITVKVPLRTTSGTIHNFIYLHKHWIDSRLRTINENRLEYTFTEGSLVPFLGSEYKIEKFDTNPDYTTSIYLRCEDIKTELEEFYRQKAREIISDRVKYFCNKLDVNYGKVFIKSQKTRWGSCSSKRNLNFNYKVVLFKKEIIDYLVIHEVSHLLEMNHSHKFWNIVKSLDPNYREHRDFLASNGFILYNFLE